MLIEGEPTIELRNRDVVLRAGDLSVVPLRRTLPRDKLRGALHHSRDECDL
ncbi:hypothetical protein CVV68_01030 [Arthrobacter livingstonensis]|uniref:Uncharacterized protein n=1 Tax=Arthrobacter livingstonensis TaxID=670078 RepID=A0A2V5LHS2_9MICC|nr:hypothetical protein CVV68_01030 [Arthrobacter livingstonensis]